MKTSDNGLRALMNFEGTVLSVYLDQAGVPTIGTGHALTKAEIASRVYDHGISRERARDLLEKDIHFAEDAVNKLVTVALNQEQFDALVSWTFNLGEGALQSSALLLKLNAGGYASVPDEMLRWCKRRDPKTGLLVVDAGLLVRRRAEGAIWNSGHADPATSQAVADATLDEDAAKAFALNFDPVELARDVEDDDRRQPTDPDIEQPT